MRLDAVRTAIEPALRRVLHFYWRFARGMTLGVRALVIDEQRRIFLVKHSYVNGWHLPGGGVETGETLIDALIRELAEEGNIEPTAPRCMWCAIFARSRHRSPIVRSSRMDSSASPSCPMTPQPARARAFSR